MFTSIVFSSYVSLFCCRIAVFLFWFCSNIVSYSQWILLKKSAFFRTFLFWSTGTAHKVCIILCIIYKIRLVSTKNESSCEREWEIEWERVAFVHFYRFPCSIPWFKGFLCSILDIFGWNHALKYPRKLNGLTWTYPAMGLSVGMLARLTCMCSCLGKFEMNIWAPRGSSCSWNGSNKTIIQLAISMFRGHLEQAWHWGLFSGCAFEMFISRCSHKFKNVYHNLQIDLSCFMLPFLCYSYMEYWTTFSYRIRNVRSNAVRLFIVLCACGFFLCLFTIS